MRWRNVNVANLANDQKKTIIELLAVIPDSQGGQKGSWILPPALGNDGTCPQILAEAIWSFQVHWKNRKVFNIIDGVVDPGMNTLRKMNELAPDVPVPAPQPQHTIVGLISRTHNGSPHDHSTCSLVTDFHGDAEDNTKGGRISHISTTINPKRTGRMICMGGMREVQYLGFEDFVPNPKFDTAMMNSWVLGRPFTTTLADGSVGDICFRSAPIDRYMREVELPRICATGCRLTYAGSITDTNKNMPYLRTLGPTLQYEIVHELHKSVSHYINQKESYVVRPVLQVKY